MIDAAYRHGAKKLLFLGSSCIYPKFAPQPIHEESLLEGALEPTNEWYAIAKIAGIKMAQAYRAQYGFPTIALMPTNLYGPGDNFDLQSSHVAPAMIRKFHEAKSPVQPKSPCGERGRRGASFCTWTIWPMRRYSRCCITIRAQILNAGTGEDLTIAELAETIRAIVGFEGKIVWDKSKPDGTPRKLLDVRGWRRSAGRRAFLWARV